MRTRVASSDWCASRKVVSVTATVCCARSARANSIGPELEQLLAGAVRRGHAQVERRQLGDGVDAHRRGAVRLVDGDVGEIAEQLGAAVARRPGGQQLRVGLDERRGDVAGREVGVLQHGREEGDVGGDAADPELRHRPPGPRHRDRERPAAAGELGQHRVEVRADLGAGVRRAAVEAHARAAGRAVRRDPAGVGAEAVGGVLGRDAALERRPAQHDAVLAEAEVARGSRPRRSASATAPGRRR